MHIALSVTSPPPVTTEGARHFGLKLGVKYVKAEHILRRGQRNYSFFTKEKKKTTQSCLEVSSTHPNESTFLMTLITMKERAEFVVN